MDWTPVLAKRIEVLTAILAGSRNQTRFRELARELAEALVDIERVRAVRFHILQSLDSFEEASASTHVAATRQLEPLWRYQRRVASRCRNALRGYYEAILPPATSVSSL